MEIQDAVKFGEEQLKDTSDSPALDTQWLLLSVLDRPTVEWLITHANDQLTADQLKKFEERLKARLTGRPLAYILGHWDFYGRSFDVNEQVLIPRPATETLVDQAKAVVNAMRTKLQRPLIIADIGTGSGCIAITLALESTGIAKIYATDISPSALSVAKKNAKKFKVADTIEFLKGDMLSPLQHKSIDLIVSNPPYVPSKELHQEKTANTKGLEFEPQQALDGGLNGLLYIEQIKKSTIPAIVEGLGGDIYTYNL